MLAIAMARSDPIPLAWAQAESASDWNALQISEIVVTAERRQENANRIGMPITPIAAAALAATHVESLQDLSSLAPGLAVAKGLVPIYSLRGVGFNSTNLGATGTVGTYVDEVAYAYPAMTGGPIFDLTRVEILKGPQGTLYGLNTTGGLIDQITNKPAGTFDGEVQAEFGNYGTHDFQGFLNVPVVPTLNTRLAFRTEDSDAGWQHSVSRPGDTLGQVHDRGVRAEADWVPTERWDVLFSLNYWANQSDPEAAQFGGLLPTSTTPPTSLFLDPYYGLGTRHPVSPPAGNGAADWEPAQLRTASTVDATGKVTSRGIDGPLAYDDRFYGLALHARRELSSDLSLVSLTGYNDLHRNEVADLGGLPIEVSTNQYSGYVRSFAEELRLDGVNGPIHWLLGGYYGDDHIYEQEKGLAGQAAVVSILRTIGAAVISPAAQTLYPGVALNPAGITPGQIANSFRDFMFTGLYHGTTSSVFANATWDIDPMFAFSGGFRYSHEHLNVLTGVRDSGDGSSAAIWNTALRYARLVGGIGSAAGLIAGIPAPLVNADPGVAGPGQWLTLNSAGKWSLSPIPERLDQDPVTGRVSFDFKPDDDMLTYASISSGAKTGTVPVTAANSFNQLFPVKDERLLAYEAGLKGALLDRALQANISIFYYDYRDKQLTAEMLDPVFVVLPRLQNVPKSFAEGIDWDLAWRMRPDLAVSFQGVLVRTGIENFTTYNNSGLPVSYEGARFPNAPRLQASLRLDYERPVSETVGLGFSLSGSYQSASYSIVPAPGDPTAALYRNPGYGLMDGSVGIHALDGRWRAMVWARNMTGTHYFTSTVGTIDATARFPGMPPTFGLLISHKF